VLPASKHLSEDAEVVQFSCNEPLVVVTDGAEDVAVEGGQGEQGQCQPQKVPVAGQIDEQDQGERPDVEQAAQSVFGED